MQVTTLQYTRRFNVAQYEHEEISVGVIPDEGQSAEDLLAKTRKFIEDSRPVVNGAAIGKAAAAQTDRLKPAPAKRGRPKKADPTPDDNSSDSSEDTSAPKKGRGRKKVSEPSETMADLLTAFEPVDLDDPDLDFDELEVLCKDVAERFRAINKPDDDSDEKREVITLLRDCRRAIDENK